MKYAYVNGQKTHIKDAERGTLGRDCWFLDYEVKVCKGLFMQYWKYTDAKPILPTGYENETEWHAAWKAAIDDECCEVVLGPNREHRADIRTQNHIIELQYSPIDIRDILERTAFYRDITNRRVIWVVNVYKARKDKRIETIKDLTDKDRFFAKWKYPQKWVVKICEPTDNHVFLDISPTADNLILLWSYHGQLFGKWVRKDSFYDKYLRGVGTSKEDFLRAVKDVDIKKFLK